MQHIVRKGCSEICLHMFNVRIFFSGGKGGKGVGFGF